MTTDRSLRLWHAMTERADGAPVTIEHLCSVATAAAGVDGTAVTVTLSATPRETLYATGRLMAELEELVLTLGEGPSVDAVGGTAALVGDLLAAEPMARWPAFAPAAASAGVRAAFALPVQLGAIRLGVLDLYRVQPGELDREQLADALVLADTACALLLDSGDHDPATPAGRRPELAGPHHPEVHQATGMITVQLGVSAAVALIRLRAHAYSHERRLRDVARDVIARRLRFESNGGPGDGQ